MRLGERGAAIERTQLPGRLDVIGQRRGETRENSAHRKTAGEAVANAASTDGCR
jgi:hypothetical protein